MDEYRRGLSYAQTAVDSLSGAHAWPLDMRLGGALMWLCSTEGLLWGVQGYDESRAEHPHGRVFPGLRFARDAVAHRLVAASRDGGLEYPMFGSTGVLEYPPVWVPRHALGLPDPGVGKSAARLAVEIETYDNEIAGRGVREPLERGLNWLRDQLPLS